MKKLTLAVIAAVIVIVGVIAALFMLNQGNRATAYTPVERFSDIHGLAVDPNDPSVLYVATHHGLIRGSSTREGSWQWALVGSYRADFMGFSMHPNGKTFYASGHKVPDAPLMGVARSDDGGFSWKIIALRGHVDFHAMTLSRANPARLYAWYYGDGKFYTSADGGYSWDSFKPQGLSSVLSLAADPTDEHTVWAATQTGLYRSTDGGRSFELISFASEPVIAVAIDPSDREKLYVSTETGAYKSTDGGQTWQELPLADTVGHFAIAPSDAAIVYAGTHRAAVYRSTEGGTSWQLIKRGE